MTWSLFRRTRTGIVAITLPARGGDGRMRGAMPKATVFTAQTGKNYRRRGKRGRKEKGKKSGGATGRTNAAVAALTVTTSVFEYGDQG
ncbi:MAG: hypothetical protein ACTHL1_13805 [Burkholderiaceae bacterium]